MEEREGQRDQQWSSSEKLGKTRYWLGRVVLGHGDEDVDAAGGRERRRAAVAGADDEHVLVDGADVERLRQADQARVGVDGEGAADVAGAQRVAEARVGAAVLVHGQQRRHHRTHRRRFEDAHLRRQKKKEEKTR